LYDDADNAYDWYYLKTTSSAPGYGYESTPMSPSRRSTYRGTSDFAISPQQWATATEMWLGYYDGTTYVGHTRIADMASGVLSNLNPNFTIVDRCH